MVRHVHKTIFVEHIWFDTYVKTTVMVYLHLRFSMNNFMVNLLFETYRMRPFVGTNAWLNTYSIACFNIHMF